MSHATVLDTPSPAMTDSELARKRERRRWTRLPCSASAS